MKQLDLRTAVQKIAREYARRAVLGISDKDILYPLLQPCDEGCHFVSGNRNYLWYAAIGTSLYPRRILETGTRYGYSLWALIQDQPLKVPGFIYSVDDQRDGEDTLGVFQAFFVNLSSITLTIDRRDTQSIKDLTEETKGYAPFDLAHIDAWHTEQGCYHECSLALPLMAPGSFIVVDDANPGCVRDGAERFCREHGLAFEFLPTLNGMLLIKVPD